MSRFGVILACALLVPSAGAGAQHPAKEPPPGGEVVSSAIERRIVKVFDFDERKLGNYEELPMNWRRISGAGFPRFLAPCFDDEVGHAAPPSFRMVLHGGSLGAYYHAKDVPVHPGSDYRLTAWIRPSGLVHARAFITAYFLDHAMQKIAGSERSSLGVGGPAGDGDWVEVGVNLPGGSEDAAWIGLTCRVEQPPEPPATRTDPRPIHHRDVHAAAWFDDLTVMRLPKASLAPLAPGGVFPPKQSVQWRAQVVDPDGVGLTADLDITDADGKLVEGHPVPVVRAGEDGVTMCLPDLPAGAYTARLSVSSGELEIAACEQPFLRLGEEVSDERCSRSSADTGVGRYDATAIRSASPTGSARGGMPASEQACRKQARVVLGAGVAGPFDMPAQKQTCHPTRPGATSPASPDGAFSAMPAAANATGETPVPHGLLPPDRPSSPPAFTPTETNPRPSRLGIIGDALTPADRRLLSHLLHVLPISAVRIPFWRADTDDAMIVEGDPRNDAWLRALDGQDAAVVAMLSDAPESLAMKEGGARRTLTDVLSSPPGEWRPYLALTLARYGTHVRAWQLGLEAGGATPTDRLKKAVANLRDELHPLIGSPDVVVGLPAIDLAEASQLPADVLSVAVPSHLDAEGMTRLLDGAKPMPPQRWWIELEPGDSQHYTRRARLAEFARRVIVALYYDPELVFVPQPWQVRGEGGDTVVTPGEELILLRTLGQVLGNLQPAAPVWLDHGVQARLFVDETDTTGVIVAWTEGDRGPEAHATQPRTVTADVGSDARCIDLWANVSEPRRTDAGAEFALDSIPVILSPVPAARGRMLAAIDVDDPTLQAVVERQQRILRLSNPLRHNLHGRLKLIVPSDWRVEPREFSIDLAPGATAPLPIYFQVPSNLAIGDYALTARLISGVDALGTLNVRMPLRIISPGLEVNVLTRTDGRGLIILQRITNLSPDSLSLRTFLIAAGSPPDERVTDDLAPGQTTVEEYRLENAARLAGRCLRVTAQQIDGPLCNNQIINFD